MNPLMAEESKSELVRMLSVGTAGIGCLLFIKDMYFKLINNIM